VNEPNLNERQQDDVLSWLRQPVSDRIKAWLWYAAWATVILVMNPVHILVAPLFPLGLMALFPNGTEGAVMLSMLWMPGLLGWLIYVLVAVVINRTRKRGVFILVYTIFCTRIP
jgi:hypothetical protein